MRSAIRKSELGYAVMSHRQSLQTVISPLANFRIAYAIQ